MDFRSETVGSHTRMYVCGNEALRLVSVMSVFPPRLLPSVKFLYIRNIRSKNLTSAVVLRRYRMKVFNASFPHTYILVCDPTVSDRKSIHSYVILRNVRFSSETPPLRKISVRYVRNIRSKNLTFAVVLRRYRMKVFMFFTKHVSTWQAKLLADLFPSLVGFVFISVYVDPHVPKYRSPKKRPTSFVSSHFHPLIRGQVAGGAAQAGGPRLPFPGPH